MVSQCYLNYEKLRDKEHFTDYYVSKKTGVPRSLFSLWRSGAHAPSLNSLEKLSNFFNVPIRYFYEGEL